MAKPATAFDLRQLYEQHGRVVFERCNYLLRDEQAAWDAVQDVFLKADKAQQGFEGRSAWRTWLVRIATNHCLNVIRSQKVRRGKGVVCFEDLDRERSAPATSERAVLARSVLALFDTQTQQAAIHYYIDEMSQSEVAQAVGLSVPTVRKRLREFIVRARHELTRSTPEAEGA